VGCEAQLALYGVAANLLEDVWGIKRRNCLGDCPGNDCGNCREMSLGITRGNVQGIVRTEISMGTIRGKSPGAPSWEMSLRDYPRKNPEDCLGKCP